MPSKQFLKIIALIVVMFIMSEIAMLIALAAP